ncbi:MAG TPA: DUF1501 domain-containing protein [Candidatus Acidoferrales bacterium]|nr:DUF1501 domain-containing protein [Candidatus Acidoferrales bacterium]
MSGIIDSTSDHNPKRTFLSRRQFWMEAGMGIGGLALIDLLSQDRLLAADTTPAPAACLSTSDAAGSPLVPKPPHFKPRAKAVISLFMSGGVSHLDTFQYKPALEKYNRLPMEGKGEIKVRQGYPGPLMQSPFSFKQYGKSGAWVSEIFPNIATLVDDLAFVHSCQGTSNDHVISHYEWNTGSVQMGFPSVGSWITYGLGSVNQNLPGFVVLLDQKGAPYAGPPNWAAGFLPAAYQGTVFRSKGDPILDLSAPSGYMTPDRERARLDQMAKLNESFDEKYPGISELSARISSYELAYRMQACAPEAVDIAKESDETKKLYGLDDPASAPYGRQCLLARRLIERGVRFVQVINGAYLSGEDTWDAHANISTNHRRHAREVDQPITGLITDLKRRGLLDETVVMWHSEFGRMPISQRGVGRDHNPGAMTVFMTGAGIEGGQHIGRTDDLGYKADEQPVTNHDLHATLLHLLGIDHKRLTFYFNGRNMRLTDVSGELLPQIAVQRPGLTRAG